jgi:hypothetical protein
MVRSSHLVPAILHHQVDDSPRLFPDIEYRTILHPNPVWEIERSQAGERSLFVLFGLLGIVRCSRLSIRTRLCMRRQVNLDSTLVDKSRLLHFSVHPCRCPGTIASLLLALSIVVIPRLFCLATRPRPRSGSRFGTTARLSLSWAT